MSDDLKVTKKYELICKRSAGKEFRATFESGALEVTLYGVDGAHCSFLPLPFALALRDWLNEMFTDAPK